MITFMIKLGPSHATSLGDEPGFWRRVSSVSIGCNGYVSREDICLSVRVKSKYSRASTAFGSDISLCSS